MLLLSTFALACVMTGIIWFVQINHYPLLLKIGKSDFTSYETAHAKTATIVIAPLMLAELSSATLLLFETKQIALATIAFLLLILIWASTFLVQLPLHKKLAMERNELHIRKLICTNWLRTIAWTLRVVILAIMLESATSI